MVPVAGVMTWQSRFDGVHDRTVVNAGNDLHFADPHRQHEWTFPCTVFLSAASRANRLGAEIPVERRDRSVAADHGESRAASDGAEFDHALRQCSRRVHAESHCLAMQEALVLGLGFERMAHGMAEVQDPPQVALAFVGGDHFGFDAHGIAR